VGERGGESFVSPDDQRARIEAECDRLGLQLIEVHSELDVSGGTPLESRVGLRAAVEAVEGGQAEVVVAAYLDRLFRSLTAQSEVVQRVEQAGGQVLAVDVGQVSEANAGQWLSGTLLGAVAEYARRTARERAGEAQRRAVERGVVPFISGPGYDRIDGKLVPNEDAPVVAEAFRMRADDGATLKEIAEYLTANGVPRSWNGVHHLLRSRVVLGEVHFGELRNTTAHEPIVDRDIWRRAQSSEARGPRPTSDLLLARLRVLRCGSCGRLMSVGTQIKGGKRYHGYRCNPHQPCAARCYIAADIAECAVVSAVREYLADIEGRASMDEHRRGAEQELARADQALDTAIRTLAGLDGEPATREVIEGLRERQEQARERLDQIGGASTLTFSIADWGSLSVDERRMVIKAAVKRAVVSPGRGADRVDVELFA
jgi:DNA invertase Pin-like site-specific DNA recombinase